MEFAWDDLDSECRLLLSLAVGVYVHESWVPFLRHKRQGSLASHLFFEALQASHALAERCLSCGLTFGRGMAGGGDAVATCGGTEIAEACRRRGPTGEQAEAEPGLGGLSVGVSYDVRHENVSLPQRECLVSFPFNSRLVLLK